MAKLDYGNMAKGIKKRFGVLSEYEQQAVEAIVEVWDYSLEEALEIVESDDNVPCRFLLVKPNLNTKGRKNAPPSSPGGA